MNLEFNIRSLLHLFFRQKKKVLILFFLIFIPGFLLTINLQPYFESKSSILLKFGENARPEVNLQSNQGFRPAVASERSEIMQSNVHIIKSLDLIKKALSKMEITKIFPDLAENEVLNEDAKLQRAAEMIQGRLSVFAGTDNYLIDISYRHVDPKIAAGVSKQIIEAFKERHTEIYDTPQINFLEAQTQEAQNKLDIKRNNFNDFKKEMGVSEIDEEIAQLLRQKNDLSSIAYRSVTEAQENLSVLEAKAAEMRATYRSDSPVMKSIRQSVGVARAQLRARQNDMVEVDDKPDGTFASQKTAIDNRIAWLEAQRGKFNELEQQVILEEENTKYYSQRMEEARVNSMLNDENISRISIIDEPRIPLNPSGPNKKFIVLAIILFAGAIAASIAIIYELLDDRFSFPNQIRSRLSLPVLATFSEAEAR